MRSTISGPLAIAIMGLAGMSACTEAQSPTGWELSARPEASDATVPETGEPEPAFRRACLTYIGGYDRMGVIGDADGSEACVYLAFLGDGAGRSPFSELDLSPGGWWSLRGISAHPSDCEQLPEEATPGDFAPAEEASGTIEFSDKEERDYPGEAVRIDIEMGFDDSASGLPGRVAFSAAELEVERTCDLLETNERAANRNEP